MIPPSNSYLFSMIEYYDTCVIKRTTGETDENGDEVFNPVYSGGCLLEMDVNARANRYDGFQFEHEPTLFIPVNNLIFKIGDKVIVETLNGRLLDYTIKNWEAIKDGEFEELNDICIWLKDGTDPQT